MPRLMKRNKENGKNSFLLFSIILIFVLVIADQLLKVWVKGNMQLGEMIPVFKNWFFLYFVENEGMAFGLSWGGKIGKIALTMIRIAVVSVLIYYFIRLIKRRSLHKITIIVFALIIAGAIGNIIDSIFYGVIYDYAPLFMGHVVDMFYFRLFRIPEWFPLWGGAWFFPAIFNIADSCVTIGLILIIIFNKPIFQDTKNEPETDAPESEEDPNRPQPELQH